MSKHTPGPWAYDLENRDVIRTEAGFNSILIAQLYKGAHTEANARLIASAPEMLEVLKRSHDHLLKIIANSDLQYPDWVESLDLNGEIAILVAKVEGKIR